MDPKYLNWHLHDGLGETDKFKLVKIMEEAAELSHAASKVLLWGPDNWDPTKPEPTSNITTLRSEWNDLKAAMRSFGLEL